MYPKIAARRIAPIAAIARRTVVDRLGNIGPRGAGAGGASMDSALDRLAALRAELHVAGDLVAIRAPAGLSRAAFAAELQARRDGLPALDARLAPRRDRRVGAAVPAELHVRGVHRPALRAGPHLLLLRRLRDHAAHLGAHRIAHADARAEADAGPGGAGGIRGRGLHGVREGELLVGRGVRPPEDFRGGHLLEGFLDRVGQRDVEAADLEDLDAEGEEVRLRVREHALFDVVQARGEIDDLQAVRLHLAQCHIELLDELALDPVLDLRGGRGAERADELVDERLRVLQAVPEISERSKLDHVEVRVLEQEGVLGPELAVEDPLLEVVHLGLLDDAGQGLDQAAQDRRVLGRERVPVRAVQVREDLAVAVEDRDLVLSDDDVVIHPDVSRDLPHDVLSLELVVPGDRHAAADAFLVARRLVRSLSAAEEESDWD